ncbi:MAG: DUF4159 domain-containing protein [Pseudomonadota bacterium]
MTLGPLSFAHPGVLLALASLPALWWLLRATPPAPRREPFPPIALLRQVTADDETAARTPWWVLAVRLALAASLILGLAGPMWNAPVRAPGAASTPLILVVDNGWASAPGFRAIQAEAIETAETAIAASRPVALLLTAEPGDQSFEPLAPQDLRARLDAIAPRPWAPDRAGLAERFGTWRAERGGARGVDIVWIADGVDYGAAAAFAEAASEAGELVLRQGGAPAVTWVEGFVQPADAGVDSAQAGPAPLRVALQRLSADASQSGALRAVSTSQKTLGEARYAFERGALSATADVDLPLALRNRISALRLSGAEHAGAVHLLDGRAKRPSVGLAASSSDEDQPLLSGAHYVEQALAPHAAFRRGTVLALTESDASIIVLVDTGRLVGDAEAALSDWVRAGGVLVRFAGPRLAALEPGDEDAALLPVALRTGGRALGGALSWSEPQSLAGFSAAGPFAGLEPGRDVTVSRQVLAEPSIDLDERTWARLGDGTPLVTGARRGEGWSVLFHVTADPRWSSLPLSGLFVDMLRRTLDLADGRAATAAPAAWEKGAALSAAYPPVRVVDGYGRLGSPPPFAPPTLGRLRDSAPGPDAPPGFYGAASSPLAFNLLERSDPPTLLAPPIGVRVETFGDRSAQALTGAVLTVAVVLLLIDGVGALALAGKLSLGRRGAGARQSASALVLLMASGFGAFGTTGFVGSAKAASPADVTDAEAALEATLTTRLAYVRTGSQEVDDVSAAGLRALSTFIARRTALEPGAPVGVDLEADEIGFFPLIYWPMIADAAPPSGPALARLDAYMKTGGVLMLDTRDADRTLGEASTPERETLQAVLERLDAPPLQPIPAEHVLTKSFYLLDSFPGRFAGGRVWVEASAAPLSQRRGERALEEDAEALALARGASNDNVSPLIIGGHDWAGAWAHDAYDRPMLPVLPGGEAQRQSAFRFGANLVIYTLTGNYKADQVHVPAILERLGQ